MSLSFLSLVGALVLSLALVVPIAAQDNSDEDMTPPSASAETVLASDDSGTSLAEPIEEETVLPLTTATALPEATIVPSPIAIVSVAPTPAPSCKIVSPFPASFRMTQAPAGVSPPVAALVGFWEGSWDFGRGIKVAIFDLTPTTAKVIYSWALWNRDPADYQNGFAQVEPDGKLSWTIPEQGQTARFNFAISADLQSLSGTQAGPTNSSMTMHRCSPS